MKTGVSIHGLAQLVADLLDMPSNKDLPGHGKPYRAVRAVFDTMIKALQNKEKVYIRGLGIFEVIRIPAQKQVANIQYLHQLGDTKVKQIYRSRPAYNRVIFRPTKAMKEFMKEDQNAD